ncbi:hypothetical protein bsdtb5_16700 [Anaeromicropila herbilytica]|uniref:Uncharacterized protein n=1 Tax=Anaeromicropila herbilytica TaxID=2785025 RepID=A0A7R7EKB1_9FIRM|nr:hypothetical protein bsdtb5_16700 [Anaeromicropila herbilytica]
MHIKNIFKKIINILFIISWLTVLGIIIVTFLIKDSLTAYNMGDYMSITGTINLICFIIIFIKAKTNNYFN